MIANKYVGAIVALILFAGCGTVTDSTTWYCEITLSLVGSTIGNLSSPSGTGTGTGRGETMQEAQNQALNGACTQLIAEISGSDLLLDACKEGRDIEVQEQFGNLSLVSVLNRSEDCGTE